jgi:diacylglycerol kinase (ATP)
MMTAKVILNPYAGRWKAKDRLEEIESALKRVGISYDLEITNAPGHGIELANQAAKSGLNPIISAGGDGSISEVINGVMQVLDRRDIKELPHIGILPLGTANDLVINLDLPLDIKTSAEVICADKTRNMDLGIVLSRYFDNNSAVGLEPTVTLIQQRITRVRGVLRYLLATFMAILQNPQWKMKLEWDDGEYYGPVTLVTVGNNPLTGGLFYMTPNADPFDGLLTFVYGFMSSRMQTLMLLPKTMKKDKGSYIEHPAVHEVHSTWLRISSENPTPIHADGEIQSESIRELEYKIVPDIIPMIVQSD